MKLKRVRLKEIAIPSNLLAKSPNPYRKYLVCFFMDGIANPKVKNLFDISKLKMIYFFTIYLDELNFLKMAANLMSLAILKMPDDSTFAGQTNPCPTLGIQTNTVMNVAPLSTTAQTQFPAGNASISVRYFSGNDVLTGNYITGSTVAQVISAANA